GLVEIDPDEPTAMQYTFYRAVVDHRKSSRTTISESRDNHPVVLIERDLGFFIEQSAVIRKTRTTADNKALHRVDHHTHVIYDARQVKVDSGNVKTPAFITVFLEKIAPWIKKHLRIVEGHMLEDRIVPMLVRTEEWTTEEESEEII